MEGTAANSGDLTARACRAGASRANLAGALGMVFGTYVAPGSLMLTLFLQDWLHAEKWHIGLVMTLAYLGPTFEPIGAFLAERLGRRRPLFIVGFLGNRLPFFGLAVIPFLDPVASRDLSIILVLGIIALTRVFAHLANPAWWSWMGDLVPEHRRGRFFARRSQVTSAAAAASFVVAMLLLHCWGGMHNRVLVSALFAAGAVFGVIDALLYFGVPEPAMRAGLGGEATRALLAPFRLPAYRRLILGVGVWAFCVNLVVPYVPIYQFGDTVDGCRLGLGLSWKFLAVLNVAGSLAAMLSSRWWGRFSDNIGPRALLLLASGHLFVNLTYLVIPPGRFLALLVVVSVISGALTAAWTVGVNQLLLGLAPRENRSVFVSAFNFANGWLMAGGPLLGGWLAGRIPLLGWTLPGGLTCCYFHLLVVVASIGGLVGLAILFLVPAPETPQTQYEIVITRIPLQRADANRIDISKEYATI